MVLFGKGTDMATGATLMVGLVSRDFLGNIGAIFAIVGVIVLPITSGDTAFRGLRLMVAEQFNIDQTSTQKRVSLSIAFFIPAAVILYIAKTNPAGFSILWRYFAFTNQFVATFALATISIYLYINGKNYLVSLIPGTFYFFVTLSFIFNAQIGFNLPWSIAYILGALCCVGYVWFVRQRATVQKDQIVQNVLS
jgi:carbon starvation protein CstA